jgi:beta-galactosidase
MLDYKRFVSDSVASYSRAQVEIVRRHDPDVFVTHNGIFKNIDYYDLAKQFDIYAHDNYPTFSDEPQYGTGAALTLCRGFNGRMMIMEQLSGPAGQTYLLRTPSPDQVRLWTMQTVAHGADGVLHFRWRGARKGAEQYWFGVLDQDDVPRRRYETFRIEGEQLAKIGPEILGSRVDSDVAVIKDFDDEWVYDHQYFTREVNVGSAYTALFQAASELKHNVDIVGPEADFGAYEIVFAPFKVVMDPGFAAKARAFVAAGGVFVVSAHTAVKTRDNAMTDETIPILVRDLFGVELDTFTCYQPPSREKNSVRFSAKTTVPVNVFADVLVTKGARAIATWDRDFFKGGAACTENAVGTGKAVYYGSFFNVEAARELLGRYAREKGLRPLVPGAPRELEVTRRTKGAASYTFLLNHADRPVTVNVGAGYADMLAGRPAPASLTLGPYGYAVLKR